MRPIQLTVKGLNSFIEEQTIDFRKLTDKGLFGIFGPTGSGKSTILDGITLALYGQIARKSSNLINMNCEDLVVTFKFQISGLPNRIYKVTRQFKRDKKTGKIKNHHSVIKEVTNDVPDILAEGSKSVTAECEKILGLSLDDFTRTVVLPQGRFSEFLKLEGKERREMLERLFNLQAYGDELSNKLKIKITHDKDRFHQITGEMSSYQAISPEVLKQEKTKLSQLMAELIALKKKQEDVTKRYKKGERIWQLQSDLKNYQEKQKQLQSEKEQIEDKKLKVQKGKIIEGIRPILEAFDETKEALEQDCDKKKQLEHQKDQLEVRKKELEVKFEQARIEKEETLIQLSNIKEHIQEVMVLEQELKTIQKERIKIEQDLENVDQKVAQFELDYQGTIKVLENLMQMLEIKQSEEKEVKVESQMRQCISEGIQLTRELLFYQSQLSELEEDYKTYLKKYQESKEENAITLEENLMPVIDQLRHTLEEGKPCPVCGSLHHFEVEYVHQKEKKENAIEKLKEKIDPLKRQLKTLQETLKTTDLEALNVCILEKDKRYEILRKEIEQLTSQMEQQRQKKETLLEKKNKWYMSRERGQSKKESCKEEQEKREKKLHERWHMILNKVPKPYIELFTALQNQLSLLKDRVDKLINQIEKNYQVLYKEKEQIQKVYDQTKIEFIEVQTTKEMHEKRLKVEELQLNQQLQEKNITLQEVRQFTLSKEMIQKMQEEIEQYQDKVIELKSSIETILKQLNHEHIEVTAWQALQQEYSAGQEAIEQKTIAYTKCQTYVQQLEVGLNHLTKLQEKKAQVEHSLAIWNDLEKLFKGKKFVEFVATNRLKYISLEASKKLMDITNGIYSLEADENGKFIICDYKNGGAKRDASTLSGGETFLVSLALALSLSAEIQLKGTAPLELFFLDEGFGTLDDTLLDVVMNSLENLHHDKLKVGIISHIDSIKERVPVKLILTPAIAGEGGTKVKIEQ